MEKENLTNKEELLFGKVGEKDKIGLAVSVPEQIIALWKDGARDLNLACRIIHIYPSSHPTVIGVVERINENLQKILALKKEISLGVFQDRLLVEGELLKPEDEGELCREFARALYKRGVATVTFSNGLKAEEIQKFIEIISIDPKEVVKKGGMAKLFLENGLGFIRVNEADYSRIFQKQEQEQGSKPREEKKVEAIGHYLVGELSKIEEEEQDLLLKLMDDPKKMAGLIYNISKEKKDSQPLAVARALGKIDDLSQNSPEGETREKLAQVITSLDPRLRLKLFKMERVAASGEEDRLGEIIPYLSKENIVDILTSALREEGEGRSLSKIFAKLVPGEDRKREIMPFIREALIKEGIIKKEQEANWERVEELLEPEEEDRYITEADMKTLITLGKEDLSGKNRYTEEERERLIPLFEPIEEESLKREEILMVLDMLELEEDKDDCLEMIKESSEKVKEYLASSQYGIPKEIIKRLNIMASSKDNGLPFRQELSLRTLDDLSSEIIDNLVSILYKSEEGREREEIFALLPYLSEKVTPPLIEQLAQEEEKERRLMLISIITSLKKIADKELINRLDDPRWYVVRNMVHILGKIRNKSVINSLLKPLKHKEARVRVEVIQALGELEEPEGLDFLIIGLKDNNKNIRQLSLRYLAAIGKERSVATLLRILKEGPYDLKLEAVRILGEIGSPKAVKDLISILKSHSLWKIRENRRLRILAILSLGKIRTEEAIDILKRGAKSFFSSSMRRACQKALQEKSPPRHEDTENFNVKCKINN